MTDARILFEEAHLGDLSLRNRFVRAGTAESMADDRGAVTPAMVALHAELAANHVGLSITGHLFCDERGRYAPKQAGIHSDAMVPGLRSLTDAVRREGGIIFAQLSHAGSQSKVAEVPALAPSRVPNPLTGRIAEAAQPREIEAAVEGFASAAARAVAAGFHGVHLHGANGYLISEFSSPITNRRGDRWGGDEARRDEFALSVVRSVRDAVPPTFPVTIKLGMVDAVPGGLSLEESLRRAGRLVVAGVDAVEVSCGMMRAPTDSAARYVGVDAQRARNDLLLHRLFSRPQPEAYYRPWASALRSAVDTKIILVGGLRSVAAMSDVIRSGSADLVAMSRPLIREPDLVRQLANGENASADCTSCNLCLKHAIDYPLRCWRVPRRRLLHAAALEIASIVGR